MSYKSPSTTPSKICRNQQVLYPKDAPRTPSNFFHLNKVETEGSVTWYGISRDKNLVSQWIRSTNCTLL
jgi:hypothetical protein